MRWLARKGARRQLAVVGSWPFEECYSVDLCSVLIAAVRGSEVVSAGTLVPVTLLLFRCSVSPEQERSVWDSRGRI